MGVLALLTPNIPRQYCRHTITTISSLDSFPVVPKYTEHKNPPTSKCCSRVLNILAMLCSCHQHLCSSSQARIVPVKHCHPIFLPPWLYFLTVISQVWVPPVIGVIQNLSFSNILSVHLCCVQMSGLPLYRHFACSLSACRSVNTWVALAPWLLCQSQLWAPV